MFKDFISEIQEGNCKRSELVLAGTCLFLFGIVLGMILAPKKLFVAGSFNGNGNDNQGNIPKAEDIKELIGKDK